jgi:hypothetical protein
MEFKGRPITSLIPLFGWRNDDIHTPIWFQKFIAWVFWKKLR